MLVRAHQERKISQRPATRRKFAGEQHPLLRRRRHHLEIRNVGRRHVPSWLVLDVDHALRFEPRVVVDRANRDRYEAGSRRVFPVDPSAAGWAEVARIDVAAVGLDCKTASVALDLDILALEERQRHVPVARRPLAILAVALARTDRLTTKREGDGAAKAATGGEGRVCHVMTFH